MKERPILFSAPMVRAILSGRKTQTRRVATWRNAPVGVYGRDPETGMQRLFGADEKPPADGLPWWELGGINGAAQHCPYGQTGDRLWVREAWAETTDIEGYHHHGEWPDRPHTKVDGEPSDVIIYRADGPWQWLDENGAETDRTHWKPSIHMPRWASRITLEITGVRVERLADISEADAIAEGIERNLSEHTPSNRWRDYSGGLPFPMPKSSYRSLWESINGAGSWAANPWVFVISFRMADRD